MDCDQVRPQVGEVVVNKRTIPIFRRTIGQELLHDVEFKAANKNLKKILDKGADYGSDEYSGALNAWLLREIQIYIPSFTKKDFEAIDHEQRKEIMAMVFEREEVKPGEATPVKKKGKGRSHGEKS